MLRRLLPAALLALPVAHRAPAQIVKPNVTGRVISTTGSPIADLEVGIASTKLTVRTDQTGHFAFVRAPEGAQEIVARGIGYLPTREPVRVPDRSTDVTVTLVPAPPVLDTVKVQARVHVLSGIVVNEHDQPVPGATIDLAAGDHASTSSDDEGWFAFTSVKGGEVVFRVRHPDYYSAAVAVRLDDWRGIVVHLESLPGDMSDTRRAEENGFGNSSVAAWSDASLRLTMRGTRAVLVSEEELRPYEDLALGDAVSRTRTGSALTFDLQWAEGSICVLQEGRKPIGSTSLNSWRASEVSLVELYPPGTETSNTVSRYLRIAGCRIVVPPSGRTRGPFYAVLWMR